ncbi:hypothetical protein H2203_000024 [Taxawa tesnikishii (nom. ined.)]|nr:hypothetical protein H2203_000024 [Dothideales sp. JES 119]
MGVIRSLVALTGYSSLAGASAFALWSRGSKFVPVPANDYIYNTTLFARYNPEKNPTMTDLCVRRVPLTKIKPDLLEKEGKLVEKFCAGVPHESIGLTMASTGYAYQRRYLEKKYRARTQDQLWDTADLLNSTYDVGTQITDHFEVVSKTPESIIVRCGDSPTIKEVRASDGLFEMRVDLKKEEGVAEFQLKSVFYQGLGRAEKGPMPSWVEFLHRQYTKVMMETAVRGLLV